MLDPLAHFVSALSSLAWPVLAGIILYVFRAEFRSIFAAIGAGLPGVMARPFRAKFPGGEFQVEGTTEHRPPAVQQPPSQAQLRAADPLVHSPARKILATLWHYQQQHFPSLTDPMKRWTFAVLPNAPLYPDYLEGRSNLIRAGLVAITSDTNQTALTGDGFVFCREHAEDLAAAERYDF
jgi:hypothetical protein